MRRLPPRPVLGSRICTESIMRAQQTESSAHRSSLRKATALRSFLLTSTSIVTLSMAAAVPQAKAQTNTTSSQWTVPAAGAGGVNGNDPLFGDTTYPGMGGTGGTVNTTNQAAISVNGTANGMPAIWINAPGGVGGNAAQADSLITQTQSGATGGTGGQITFTNSAPLTSTDSQTIWLFAYGGVGGSGATSHVSPQALPEWAAKAERLQQQSVRRSTRAT
jgi:hypothetical protein